MGSEDADVTAEPSAVAVRAFRPGDEIAIVALLNAAYPGGWGSFQRWRVKHLLRPGFDPDDVQLAELDGTLVGCLHSIVVPIRLGPEASVLAAIDGDLAVDPERRGKGIPQLLFARSDERLAARGVVLRLLYTDASRLNYYRRVLGYVAGFDTSRAYRKQTDARSVNDRLLSLLGGNPDGADPGVGPIVAIEVTGLPTIRLRLGPAGAVPAAGTGVDLRVWADQRLFNVVGEGKIDLGAAWSLWRSEDLRFRGSVAAALRVALWTARRARGLLRVNRAE